MFGKQIHYCPNCGVQQYDSRLENTVRATMCSRECLREWETKYARMILGMNGLEQAKAEREAKP
jgi:hypothetical protein